MLTLQRYEQLHERYPWLVWLPVTDRRAFAGMLETATSDEDERRLAAWWQSTVQRSLAAGTPDVTVRRVPTAA